MKKQLFVIILTIFSIVLFTECQKEQLEISELTNRTVLAKKDFTDLSTIEAEYRELNDVLAHARGGGMGMGGSGGSEPIYRVEYHGALGFVGFSRGGKDSPKHQLLMPGACPPKEYTGIPGLVGGCFPDPLVNKWTQTIRLLDKKAAEQNIRISVWHFITINESNYWLKLYGSLCEDQTCGNIGGTTILPNLPGDENAVWIKLDRMVVEGTLDCDIDRLLTEDVRIKVELIDDPNWICP